MNDNMETTFTGLKTFDENEKKKMISNSLIVLDTNILLNIYRCSEEASTNFLNALSLKSESLWLPYFAGVEFYKNKEIVCKEVLESVSKTTKEFYNKINKAEDDLKKLFQNYKDEEEYNQLIKLIDEEYKQIKEKLDEFYKNKEKELSKGFKKKDKSIVNLIGNNITPKLETDELNKVLKEGEFRLEKEISPGFKDNHKNDYINGIKVNGDYIIWDSIITLAKEKESDVILLTNDLKCDYYDQKNKKINFELQREFFYKTGHSIVLLSFDEFIKIYNSTIPTKEEKITKETKDEMTKINNYFVFKNLSDKSENLNEVKLEGTLNSLKKLSIIDNDPIIKLENQLRIISDTIDKYKLDNKIRTISDTVNKYNLDNSSLYNSFINEVNQEDDE